MAGQMMAACEVRRVKQASGQHQPTTRGINGLSALYRDALCCASHERGTIRQDSNGSLRAQLVCSRPQVLTRNCRPYTAKVRITRRMAAIADQGHDLRGLFKQRPQEAHQTTPVTASGAGCHDGPVARMSVSVTQESGATQVGGFWTGDIASIR